MDSCLRDEDNETMNKRLAGLLFEKTKDKLRLVAIDTYKFLRIGPSNNASKLLRSVFFYGSQKFGSFLEKTVRDIEKLFVGGYSVKNSTF